MRPRLGARLRGFVLALACLRAAAPCAAADATLEIRSYVDVEALFVERGYTQAAWDAGLRDVPRLFIVEIPSRWRENVAQSLRVETKKEIFFRLIGPLVLEANARIAADRARLVAVQQRFASDQPPAAAEMQWLRTLAERYRVQATQTGPMLDALLRRVDAVPPSLALAQSAEESGWGTSRFADLGNALFGQWTWDDGIAPLERREGKGNYGIARFDTPLASVEAYMRNLNTHSAYRELRARRAELRAAGRPLDGYELANSLTRYSERGQAYVDSLHLLMRVNGLRAVDAAVLRDEPPLYLVPVDADAE